MNDGFPPGEGDHPGPAVIARLLHRQGIVTDPDDPKLLEALGRLTPEDLDRAKAICDGTPGADPFVVSLILMALTEG